MNATSTAAKRGRSKAKASTTMVHVRIPKSIKADAFKALESMGLSLSDAVRLLLKRIAIEKAIPFDVHVPHVPNAATVRALREAQRGTAKVAFPSREALFAELNAED